MEWNVTLLICLCALDLDQMTFTDTYEYMILTGEDSKTCNPAYQNELFIGQGFQNYSFKKVYSDRQMSPKTHSLVVTRGSAIAQRQRESAVITPFMVLQCHRFWYHSKARMHCILPANTYVSHVAPFSTYRTKLVKYCLWLWQQGGASLLRLTQTHSSLVIFANIIINHCQKLDSLDNIFVADTCLTSTSLSSAASQPINEGGQSPGAPKVQGAPSATCKNLSRNYHRHATDIRHTDNKCIVCISSCWSGPVFCYPSAVHGTWDTFVPRGKASSPWRQL